MYMGVCIYIYIHTYTHIHIHIYIYMCVGAPAWKQERPAREGRGLLQDGPDREVRKGVEADPIKSGLGFDLRSWLTEWD